MAAILCITGLMLFLAGSIGFWMSIYVFWDEAIQKNSRWALALFGPPFALGVCWGSAYLMLRAVPMLPDDAILLYRLAALVITALDILGWLSLAAIPIAWLTCAVMCWDVVRQGVWGGLVSCGAFGIAASELYVMTICFGS